MVSVKILDTTIAEEGPEQKVDYPFLKGNTPLRFSVDLPAGEEIVIYGRTDARDTYNVLHTFTEEKSADIYPSRFMKAARSVDGGGDVEVFISNVFLLDGLVEHEA